MEMEFIVQLMNDFYGAGMELVGRAAKEEGRACPSARPCAVLVLVAFHEDLGLCLGLLAGDARLRLHDVGDQAVEDLVRILALRDERLAQLRAHAQVEGVVEVAERFVHGVLERRDELGQTVRYLLDLVVLRAAEDQSVTEAVGRLAVILRAGHDRLLDCDRFLLRRDRIRHLLLLLLRLLFAQAYLEDTPSSRLCQGNFGHFSAPRK